MTIFDELNQREVDQVKNAGTRFTLPADWSPIQEKTGADKAYIILSGEASVRRKGEEVAKLGEGDIFGELALVNHALRSASIVTLTKVEVLHFTRDQIEQLRRDVPAFGKALDRVTEARLES